MKDLVKYETIKALKKVIDKDNANTKANQRSSWGTKTEGPFTDNNQR